MSSHSITFMAPIIVGTRISALKKVADLYRHRAGCFHGRWRSRQWRPSCIKDPATASPGRERASAIHGKDWPHPCPSRPRPTSLPGSSRGCSQRICARASGPSGEHGARRRFGQSLAHHLAGESGELPDQGGLGLFADATAWLNSAAPHARGPARQGRPRRLLDLHVRQLAAHPALRPRVGNQVSRPGVGRSRCPHARISPSSTTSTTSASR